MVCLCAPQLCAQLSTASSAGCCLLPGPLPPPAPGIASSSLAAGSGLMTTRPPRHLLSLSGILLLVLPKFIVTNIPPTLHHPCLASRTKPCLIALPRRRAVRSLGGSRPGPGVLCPVPAPLPLCSHRTPSSHRCTCCAVAPPSRSCSQAAAQQLSALWLPPSRGASSSALWCFLGRELSWWRWCGRIVSSVCPLSDCLWFTSVLRGLAFGEREREQVRP